MKTRKRTDYLVVHCSDTPPSMDIGVVEITKWHIGRGFSGIGYHFVIRRDGTVETGRAQNAVGAHVQGYNSISLGICLVGGKGGPNYSALQMTALASLLQKLKKDYPAAKVCGHRDFPGVAKECPCFDVGEWWQKQRASGGKA